LYALAVPFSFPMTYIRNIPEATAELLAISMLQHSPDEQYRQFVFNSEVGAGDDEVIVVTYERRIKTPTLQVFVAKPGMLASVANNV
jgi:hypothetical protein